MTVIGELFFYAGFGKRPALSDALRHNLEKNVRSEVDGLSDSVFAKQTDAELIETIVEKCRAHPIILKVENATGDAKPIKLTMEDRFHGQVAVDGLRVTKTIPFEGDAVLFELQPDQYDLSPPRGTVRGQSVTVGMDVRQAQGEDVVRYIEESVSDIQTYIGRQAAAIEAHNASLPGVASEMIQRRRAVLGAASDIASRLTGR
jgi:hypothetical protein